MPEKATVFAFDGALAPTRWTIPDHSINWDYSDGERACQLAELVFKTGEGKPLRLDLWQRHLICNILVRFPKDYDDPLLAGRLKYRQVLVSVSRQNGKSLIGAILGLYGLILHYEQAYVIGVASSKEQSQIVYDRVLNVINSTPALKAQFTKTTDTRGIANKTRTKRFELKASKGAALQGLPITLCVFDEVHICPPALWSAVVLGTTTFRDGIVVGITTCGDDNSTLLKDLYARGEEAIKGQNERFGFFCWESPTDDLTPENILLSSPAIACGRVSLEDTMNDIRAMPVSEAIRYRANRWVGSSSPWLAPDVWAKALGPSVSPTGAYVAIDRTPNWTNASIAAAQKVDNEIHAEVIAAFNTPSQASLYEYAKTLYKYRPTFVMDAYSLKPLADQIKADGQEVITLSSGDVVNACERAYSMLHTGRLKHAGDDLLTYQSLRAKTKSVGTHWRVVRGSTDIDAVMAWTFAAYAADSLRPAEIQLW